MKVNRLFIAISILLVSSVAFGQNKTKAVTAAYKIDYENFFNHVKYFASDELEGRDVASEGYDKAAKYTAQKFKDIGLVPFGDNNSYFQKVPFLKSSIDASTFQLTVVNKKRKARGLYGKNISVMLSSEKEDVQAELDLVFVGYGNVFPDKEIDDYKGMDVKGKTVIVASGAPDGVQDPRLLDPRFKAFTALKKGAKGVIIFTPNQDSAQKMMFDGFHSFMKGPSLTVSDGSPFKPMINMDFLGYARKDLIKEIFKVNKMKLKKYIKSMAKGKSVSKELKSKLHYSYKAKHENINCKNIVALLEGSDPALKDEYIVVSAHLDHVGVGNPIKGDSIYNGMWDNATGSASVISIAEELQKNNLQTKRSIIFVCYTAEEKGLMGSKYFANSEILKDKKVVANVNIDMLGGLFETTDITPEGYSHSNLSEAVDFATNVLNLSINDPIASEKMYMERSDQVSFIRVGTPAMNVGSGINSVDPELNITEILEKWMKTIYHSPFDDLEQKYSDKAFLTYLKVNFLITYYAANEIEEIKWNKEGWVYKKYLAKK